DRIIGYATSQGKRAFAALVPDNAYGTVVEAAFKQGVARRGGRVVALERYPLDKAQMQAPVRNVAQSAARADAIFVPDCADAVAYAGPESTVFRSFSARYRGRYGQDPVRTASLSYDAVALVAALVKTQGQQRFSEAVL